jgi:hypothetical protein
MEVEEVEVEEKQEVGPYWQMVYYAVVGFMFWAILMIQIPFIDKYFGGPSVVFYLTFAYGLSSNVTRVFLVIHAAKTTASRSTQMKNLIIFGSLFTALTMSGFPLSMVILNTDNGHISFWVCIVLAGLMGVWNSLLMNAGFALMSMAPDKSATFFLLGQTMTGVVSWPLIVLLRLVVTSLVGDPQSTDYCVAIATLSIAALIPLGTMPLYLFKTRFHPVFAQTLSSPHNIDMLVRRAPTFGALYAVFKAMLIPVICGWLCGLITFAVYPSQVSLWSPSVEDAPYDASLYRSFLLYMFSVSETVGRALFRVFPKLQQISDKLLFNATVLRGIVFIPLMILSSKHIPKIFAFDGFRLVVILLLGLSNGANFGLASFIGPKRISAADKMHAGTILSFTAVNGLFVGSMIGIGFKHI